MRFNEAQRTFLDPGNDRKAAPKPFKISETDFRAAVFLSGRQRFKMSIQEICQRGINKSWSWRHIEHPSQVLKEGDSLNLKVLSIDPEQKRLALSRKQVLEELGQDEDQE